MNTKKYLLLLGLIFLFYSCGEKSPLEVKQLELDEPNTPPTINTQNLMSGSDFTIGYDNGNIRSDRAQIEWDASTDDNFLCYKVFRKLGGTEIDIFEGFESGNLPSGWTEYGDNGGWEVTGAFMYEGNYSARSNSGYYGSDYLEVTFEVPPESNIFISFWGFGVDDGYGYLYINGTMVEHWGYDYYGPNWVHFSNTYYTGPSTQMTLQWVYGSGYYGYGYIDNIEITGLAGLAYSQIETIIDKNDTTFLDTTLNQDTYYQFKAAVILDNGMNRVDDIQIKTPKWSPPSNLAVIGLSPTIAEISWDDNTESESSFAVYVDTFGVSDWITINTLTAAKNDSDIVITGLESGQSYRFGVKALNNWEETDTAYTSSFTLDFDPPTNLYASQITGTKSVELSWSDNSTLESGFNIERRINSGAFQSLAGVDANVTFYTDTDTTGYAFGDTITYRVRAYNNYSDTIYTAYSNEAEVILSTYTMLYEGFESGVIPSGWSTWTSGGTGWYITSGAAYEGNYSITCGGGYYDTEYLEYTMSVPQYTTIYISFYTREVDTSGDGYLYINGYYNFEWDNNASSWYSRSTYYNTGSNSSIILRWEYNTYNYGNTYLDNIQVTW